MKTHRNLPFFVPFAGCPHRCSFCDQVCITGKRQDPSPREELALLDHMLETCGDISQTENQIAFFGGSFTNIPRARMISLLERANVWIDRGMASSIRISTRPDCIDKEILSVLKTYRVTDVELGIQSMENAVLAACERGHTAEDSLRAMALLRENGFRFAGQMMIGLPGSTAESEEQTARTICQAGACEARIYPTVVFPHTKLYEQTRSGDYTPLTDLQAARRIVPCLEQFASRHVRVLKVGLQSSEQLQSAPFGPTDGSIGELATGLMYAKRIAGRIGTQANGKQLTLRVNPSDLSKWRGHGACALRELEQQLSTTRILLQTDASVCKGDPVYTLEEGEEGNHAAECCRNAGIQILP